jgi:hypothetical protein
MGDKPQFRRFVFVIAVGTTSLVACTPVKPTMPAPVPVTGQVVDAAGKPVTKLMISFHAQDGPQAGNRPADALDKDGRFKVSCVPGRYKVTLAPIPSSHGSTEGGEELAAPPAKRAEPPKRFQGIPRAYSDAASSPWDVTILPEGKELTLKVE